jgi:alkanesulfonate monooxygenase SsuD/methylene tetrahydromethanopterin reductase-like flavin-dependent oxidoreductase (luciferase family)
MESDKCCPKCGAATVTVEDDAVFTCGSWLLGPFETAAEYGDGVAPWSMVNQSERCARAVAERERDWARAERDVARQGGARMVNDNIVLTSRAEAAERERDALKRKFDCLYVDLEAVNILARAFGWGQGELDDDLADCLRQSIDRLTRERDEAAGMLRRFRDEPGRVFSCMSTIDDVGAFLARIDAKGGGK